MKRTSFSIFRSMFVGAGGLELSANCLIKLEHVDMSYPSGVYNATTIKQAIFERLRFEKKKALLRDVHALRDVTITINEGDRVGVVGRNGSGKSTLLKIIGGIYPIERGRIEVVGKIRALFEISLGFDLESSGRENILYRSLLLGAHPKEVKEKMQEIINFAGLGEFIEYPVKSYSTGMAVRLAFAVSTSIDGEILLLDEVIGAGDAGFATKAFERIHRLVDISKIMVLVSHDLGTVKSLCNRAIWLDGGVLRADGKPDEVVAAYLASV